MTIMMTMANFVVVFLLQLKLAVHLTRLVQNLSKASALEYAEEDGHDAVAEQAPNVGIHRHLSGQS